MVRVEPWIVFSTQELDALKTIQGVVSGILDNLKKLEEPMDYATSINVLTAILDDMKLIEADYFDPILERKLKIKELAKKIDELNSG